MFYDENLFCDLMSCVLFLKKVFEIVFCVFTEFIARPLCKISLSNKV